MKLFNSITKYIKTKRRAWRIEKSAKIIRKLAPLMAKTKFNAYEWQSIFHIGIYKIEYFYGIRASLVEVFKNGRTILEYVDQTVQYGALLGLNDCKCIGPEVDQLFYTLLEAPGSLIGEI